MKGQENIDFGLWDVIQEMEKLITINIQRTTIKSHASARQCKKQGLIPSALNDIIDDWANLGRQIPYNPPQFFISESQIMAQCRGNFLHSLVRPQI